MCNLPWEGSWSVHVLFKHQCFYKPAQQRALAGARRARVPGTLGPSRSLPEPLGLGNLPRAENPPSTKALTAARDGTFLLSICVMLPETALVSCAAILCRALPAWVPGAGLTGVCGSSPAPSTARSPRSSVSLRMLMVVASCWMSWTAFLRPARSQEIKSVYVLDSTSIASLYACKTLRRKHSCEVRDAQRASSHGSPRVRLLRGVKLQHEKNSPCNSAPVPLTAATEISDISPVTWGSVRGHPP